MEAVEGGLLHPVLSRWGGVLTEPNPTFASVELHFVSPNLCEEVLSANQALG
jgi:hypothetical protein